MKSAPQSANHSLQKPPASRHDVHSSSDRNPLFSTASTLFSIHNFAHPLSLVAITHSCAKTPGVRGPINSLSISRATPIESNCFAIIPRNPHRIILFHKQHGVGRPQLVFSSLRTLRPSALKSPFHHDQTSTAPRRRSSRRPIIGRRLQWC